MSIRRRVQQLESACLPNATDQTVAVYRVFFVSPDGPARGEVKAAAITGHCGMVMRNVDETECTFLERIDRLAERLAANCPEK